MLKVLDQDKALNFGIGGGDYNTGLASQDGGGQGFRQAQPIKAYVVSQEVTSSQNMNATIESLLS